MMINSIPTPMSLLGDGCAFCHDQEVTVNLVEILGFLSGFACTQCLVDRGKYCTTHDEMYQGFIDGTSACKKCITDFANENLVQAREFLCEVREKFPPSEVELVNELLEITRYLPELSEELLLSHWIATCAVRRGISFENVIITIRSEIGLSGILPSFF